jgi:hypothetical protein
VGGGNIINQIALFTAMIATVGAIFGYMSGATQANAGLYKNNAAIKKTEASNQWNYFQSKSTKQSLAEISRDLTAVEADKTKYQAKIDRYWKQKRPIGIKNPMCKCTSITAGRNRPPCCRWPSHWLQLLC